MSLGALLLAQDIGCGRETGDDAHAPSPPSAPESGDGTVAAPTEPQLPVDAGALDSGSDGSSPSHGATQAPVRPEIVSEDGRLTILVPDGATPDPSGITVTVVAGDSYGIDGPVYEIEPSGLTFAVPIEIVFRLEDRPSLRDGSEAVFVATKVNEDWAPVAANRTELLDDHVLVRGWISHLSPYTVISRFGCEPLVTATLCESPRLWTSSRPLSDCMAACLSPLPMFMDCVGVPFAGSSYGIYSWTTGSMCLEVCASPCREPGYCFGAIDQCNSQCSARFDSTCGAGAQEDLCSCLSSDSWLVDTQPPCVIDVGDTVGLYSRSPNQDASCSGSGDPTANSETTQFRAACSGTYEIESTIKAGDALAPRPDDCIIVQSVAEFSYPVPNEYQEIVLPGWWTDNDPGCIRRFIDQGGYRELAVRRSSACEETIMPYLLRRLQY